MPAMLLGIRDPAGDLAGIEVTYLSPDGNRDTSLRLSRKTIGQRPASSAVRIDPAADEMLVGEGFFTTLSASERFQLPAWALMSINNLRIWRPPPGVKRVLVAGDNGGPGQTSAHHLVHELRRSGLTAEAHFPPPQFDDWNSFARNLSRATA